MIKEHDSGQKNKKKKVNTSWRKKNSSQLSLELSLEFYKDDHMIDYPSIQKIMQNHPYNNSSKFCHWNDQSDI
jgi:hypothetical protein